MKISKLALIALLGGALMAFGCSDDDGNNNGGGNEGGDGGSGGVGGDGGGGAGGDGGTGGMAAPEPGVYSFTCNLEGLPIPLPVTVTIGTADADPALTEGAESTLTTQLNFTVAPAVIDLLPNLAPDAAISDLTSSIGVTNGGDLSVIDHTAGDPLPQAPQAMFDSDIVDDSAITPGAGSVELSVATFVTVITGLEDILGFDLTLEAGVNECGPLVGEPLVLEVAAPAQ
jgi:hypothetical protein